MITEGQVIDLLREGLYLVIICAAPCLLVSLVVGLVVSVFQTITSIQEQTLTFVPKIVAVFLTLMLCASWIMGQLTDFLSDVVNNFSVYLM